MKFAIMALGAAVGLGAFANIAMAPPPFDYNTADHLERQEWMRGKALQLNAQALFYTPEADGAAPLAVFMNSVESDVARRELRLHIDVDIPDGSRLGAVPAPALRASLCALSERMGLGAQGVALTAIYADDADGRPVMRARARPQDCASHAG